MLKLWFTKEKDADVEWHLVGGCEECEEEEGEEEDEDEDESSIDLAALRELAMVVQTARLIPQLSKDGSSEETSRLHEKLYEVANLLGEELLTEDKELNAGLTARLVSATKKAMDISSRLERLTDELRFPDQAQS